MRGTLGRYSKDANARLRAGACPIRQKMSCGIYSFIHRETLACYVGSSLNIERRKLAHLSAASRGSMNCFHRALRDLGIDAFDFEVLEHCEPSEMLAREYFYISLLDSSSLNGFNVLSKPNPNRLNATHLESTKKRIGAANRISLTGKTLSGEHRKNISIGHLGAKRTPEQCRRISESLKGKAISEETKRKISATLKGRTVPDSVRRKIANSMKGSTRSAESIRKGVLKRIGAIRTPEQCERIRAGIWAARKL